MASSTLPAPKSTIGTIKKILLTLLLSCITYASIMLVSNAIHTATRSGAWAEWQSLGTPPADAREIATLLPDPNSPNVDVFVRSATGEIFHRTLETMAAWEKVASVPTSRQQAVQCNLNAATFLPHHGSYTEPHPISINRRSDIVDCAAMIWAWEWGADAVTYVALTQNQEVLQWHANFSGDLGQQLGFMYCALPLFSLCVGSAGTGLFVLIHRRRQRRSQAAS